MITVDYGRRPVLRRPHGLRATVAACDGPVSDSTVAVMAGCRFASIYILASLDEQHRVYKASDLATRSFVIGFRCKATHKGAASW